MILFRKSYRKAALLLLWGLFILAMGAPKTHAALSRLAYIKNIFRKSAPPKGYGRVLLPTHPSSPFTTPSFHDFSSKGSGSGVDLNKINFGMGPQPTPSFVGRKQEIASLSPYFNSTDKLVVLPPIIGFDGVGKTQLALQLVKQYGAQYDYIIWINAATVADIEASYRQIAKALGLKLAPNEDPSTVIHLVEARLKGKRVLYLFDDAPNLRTIQPYLQQGHILITSSNTTTSDWTSSHYDAPLALAPLGGEAALELVQKMGYDTTDPSLIALIQLLPTYPLAMVQALNDMRARQYTPKAFLDELKQNTALMEQLQADQQVYKTYRHTLYGIIKNQLEALRRGENGEDLLHLLQQLSCLDAQPIPLSFVLLALGNPAAPSQMGDMLLTLAKHGLITQDHAHIHMHGVIQTLISNLYPLTHAQVDNLIDRYAAHTIDKVVGASYPTADFYHEMIAQGQKLLAYLEKRGDNRDTARCYFQLSCLYYQQGHYQNAITSGKRAVGMLIQVYGESPNAQVAAYFNHLGNVYLAQKKYDEAIEYHQRALNISQKVYGNAPHPDIAGGYHNLGNVYAHQKRYDQALALYKQALKMRKQLYGDTPHIDMALSYNTLGSVYCEQKLYRNALVLYKKSLEIREAIYGGKPHHDIAIAYNNLGTVYREQGLYELALECYQKSLDMFEKVYGSSSHPDMAFPYIGMSIVYYGKGDIALANKFHIKGIAVEHTLPATTISTQEDAYQQHGAPLPDHIAR